MKPLAQINFRDRNGELFVRVGNNGIGPLIVDRITFTKDGQDYYRIEDCLDIDPKMYFHIEISDTNNKIVVPGGYVELFSKTLDPRDNEAMLLSFQKQLAALNLKVEGRDIYNNTISVEKDLKWFARHHKN